MTTDRDSVACVVDSKDSLGEGCLWDPVTECLWWLDIARPSCIHCFNPATGERRLWASSILLTAMARRRQGGFILAGEHGLHTFDEATGAILPFHQPEPDMGTNRFNDGACDTAGRFWVGSMQNNIGPAGEDFDITENTGVLYRVQPDGTSHRMMDCIGVSNGPCWSPDGGTFYFSDSRRQIIYAFDFDVNEGRMSNRRVFNDSNSHGHPDGATVDAEGYLWSARWDGGCVLRIDPKGRIDRIVATPATRPTCICFGGPDMRTAFVTSSRAHVSADVLARFPMQGGVFSFEPGVAGLHKNVFAG